MKRQKPSINGALRRFWISVLYCWLLGVGWAVFVQASAFSDAGETVVLHCRLDTEVDDGMAALVRRLVEREARKQSVSAIILEINTFGGRVDSAVEITDVLSEAPCPVLAYVTGKGAISAGALISYACDTIVMAPGTSIGASAPVMLGAPAEEEVTEKSMSFLRAKYRALGEMNGHNPLLGEAMVDEQIELYGWPADGGGFTIVKVENGQIVESTSSQSGNISGRPNTVHISLGPVYAQEPIPVPVTPEEWFRNIQPLPPGADETLSEENKRNKASPNSREESSNHPLPAGLPPEARLISSSGKLLTLTAQEAVQYGLAKGIASSLTEALLAAGLPSDRPVLTVEKRWDERVFSFLTHPVISGLLLMCGVMGIYMEMKTPGFGWYGIVGILSLCLFMGSRMVLGLSDWFDLALVLAGVALIAVEIFYLPGFGWAGISGFICLFLGLYLALTRVPVPRYTWDFERLADAGTTMAIATVSFLFLAYAVWKYLPQTAIGHRLFLRESQQAASGWVSPSPVVPSLTPGSRGKALSMLRPAGKGLFDGKIVDIETEGSFIEPGRVVVVIAVEGNRILVREIAEDETVIGEGSQS